MLKAHNAAIQDPSSIGDQNLSESQESFSAKAPSVIRRSEIKNYSSLPISAPHFE